MQNNANEGQFPARFLDETYSRAMRAKKKVKGVVLILGCQDERARVPTVAHRSWNENEDREMRRNYTHKSELAKKTKQQKRLTRIYEKRRQKDGHEK